MVLTSNQLRISWVKGRSFANPFGHWDNLIGLRTIVIGPLDLTWTLDGDR